MGCDVGQHKTRAVRLMSCAHLHLYPKPTSFTIPTDFAVTLGLLQWHVYPSKKNVFHSLLSAPSHWNWLEHNLKLQGASVDILTWQKVKDFHISTEHTKYLQNDVPRSSWVHLPCASLLSSWLQLSTIRLSPHLSPFTNCPIQERSTRINAIGQCDWSRTLSTAPSPSARICRHLINIFFQVLHSVTDSADHCSTPRIDSNTMALIQR